MNIRKLCKQYGQKEVELIDLNSKISIYIERLKEAKNILELKRVKLILPDCQAKWDLIVYLTNIEE